MNIMKKRISLFLGIMMLMLTIIPVVNVNAAEACHVTMTVKMGTTTMVENGRYNVKGGETITVKASSAAGIERIGYCFGYGSDVKITDVYKDTITITVPQRRAGYEELLRIEAIDNDDDGTANKVTKTGWIKYTLVYPNDSVEMVENKAIKVTKDSTKTASSSYVFTIPETMEANKEYSLYVNATYSDGLCVDGNAPAVSRAQTFNFILEDEEIDRDSIIEPWMEENDDNGELSVSLRNDSEVEEKANKNIYELNETVTYYIDYKNGGKDIDGDVTIILDLPLDYEVIDIDGGKINEDGEIEWVLNGVEEGEAGTIVAKVKYTELKKSKDDANTIYPSASILKGSKVKDVSTVINYIITDYDVELDIEHEPYMYGDADADTFRPDYIITRAEGALVLARIFGLDYEKETTITTKYTDINDTYLEAQKAITAASKAGLINGYLEDDGTYTYRPNSKMTKAEFMKILACMIQENAEEEGIDGLQIKGLDQLVKNYDDTKRYYMVDGERVYKHWAIEEITLLARLNMLPLNEDNTEFELDEKITRAEVAQLINFYLLRAPADVTSKTKTGFSDVSRKHDLVGDIIEATRETHTFSITEEVTEVEE